MTLTSIDLSSIGQKNFNYSKVFFLLLHDNIELYSKAKYNCNACILSVWIQKKHLSSSLEFSDLRRKRVREVLPNCSFSFT